MKLNNNIKLIIPIWGLVYAMEKWTNRREMSWKTLKWYILSLIELFYVFAAYIIFMIIWYK